MTPKVSVVIPMLNESRNIAALFARLFPVLEGLADPHEVVVVDDGSTDDTLALVKAEQARRPTLRVVSFARNFGQHAAVLAGFEAARGEWIVTLDADLQNPPEEIPRLIDAMRAGHDLVNTVREGRRDPIFRKVASKIINEVARRASGIRLNDFGCMLRGYHRDVVAPMIRRRELNTFIPALAMLYARRPIEVNVKHAAREQGVSNYSLWKLFRLQLDLITSFSLAPLRALFTVGGLVALLGMGLGLYILGMRAYYGDAWAAQGVFTLFAILFFFVGAQFLAFGLLGEYVGRIYMEVRDRPAFLIREATDAPSAAPASAVPAPQAAPAARELVGQAPAGAAK